MRWFPGRASKLWSWPREGAAGTEREGAQGSKRGTVRRGAGSLSEARAGTRVGSVGTAREWGRYQSRWALTEAAHTGCAHHWPAHGWQGCSIWEVTSSLSRGHREGEGMGGKEGEGDGVGRRPLLTWVSWTEQSKRIPMPSLEASSPRAEPLHPCLGCTTQPVGP